MADSKLKLDIGLPECLAMAAAVALAGNWLAVKFGDYPFLYCWFSPYLSQFYIAAAGLLLYLVAGFIVFNLIFFRPARVLYGCMAFFGIVELPTLAEMVFRLGGSCHG